MAGKALLVGINDYAPAGAGGPDLRGCVNDVRDAAMTLTTLGVVVPAPGAVRILTNAAATKVNIVNGLKWLLTPAPGVNHLVFYYSGHGTHVVDTSGDEALDHVDEAICPHDFPTAGFITDDLFRAMFAHVPPGITLEVILDSCFSGTGTRMARMLHAAPGEEGFTPRCIDPPVDIGFFTESNPTLPISRFSAPQPPPHKRDVAVVPGMNHILWAASRANQTSGEGNIGGVIRGAFSYAFFKTLRDTHAGVPRRVIDARVTALVHALGFGQTPQLECNVAEVGDLVFREMAGV